MRQPESKPAISREEYDAVLLDLDGVITDTAGAHAAVGNRCLTNICKSE
jgi:phosphoglycolate phosphatase-like HAD superfamily hydrolase